jgi:hypothetical protein
MSGTEQRLAGQGVNMVKRLHGLNHRRDISTAWLGHSLRHLGGYEKPGNPRKTA